MLSKIKSIIKPVWLYLRNVMYKILNKPEAIGVILMLHRVSDREVGRLKPNENMKVSPNHLASFIEAAMKKYEIIKLDDVPH